MVIDLPPPWALVFLLVAGLLAGAMNAATTPAVGVASLFT